MWESLHNEGEINKTIDSTMNTTSITPDVLHQTQEIVKVSSVDIEKVTDNLLTHCWSKSSVNDNAEDEDSSQHDLKREVVIVEQTVGCKTDTGHEEISN